MQTIALAVTRANRSVSPGWRRPGRVAGSARHRNGRRL